MTIKEYLKNYKFWLLIAALIFTFLFVYSPHFSYKFPLHADEWLHIEYAKKLLNSEYSLHHELGYHLFLAFLFKLGLSITSYKFLPAIFAVFAAIFLFLLMYKLTKNYWIALFSIIFFASLPSNVNLLGLWFAIPLTLAIPLIYLFFYFFIKAVNQNNNYKKNTIIATSVLFVLALVHGPSAAFLLPIIIIYSLINYKEVRKKPFLIIILLPYLIYIFVLFKAFWRGDLKTTYDQIKFNLQYVPDESSLNPSIYKNPIISEFNNTIVYISPYFLPILYGIIPFILAMIGLFFSIKSKKPRVLAVWFLVIVFLLFLSKIIGIDLIARNQRMIYYALLSLAPLSGMGLYKFLSFIKSKLENKSIQPKKISIILTIIMLLILITTFYNYGKQRQGTELYHIIDNSDYEALTFLKTQEKGLVLAPLNQAATVYALSNNEVIARFWPIENKEKYDDVERFFSSICSEQQKIIEKYNINYIYSKSSIFCNWQEIYNKDRFIYKTS